jgi:flagellar biosynthesis protein FlhF
MKIKSYYSRTVEDAMASARQELGPEAMLLNTRKAPAESRHLGEYEVVFATLAPQPSDEDPSVASAAGTSTSDRLSQEFSELKRELEGMRRALTRSAYAPSEWAGVPQDVSDAYATLTAAEISPDLAREIVQAAGARLSNQRGSSLRTVSRGDGANFQRALIEELQSRFTVDSSLGTSQATPRIVALIGPPGSGKTSTLVKLAVNYGLAARRGVLLLSMDTHRVGAADQLRGYAAILGVNVHVAETTGALAQTIEENRAKELIFIDTPGLTQNELDDEAALAPFLSNRPDIDIHLVLPASMKPADLTRIVDGFGVFHPDRLLFTRLDETGSCGSIFNEAARTGKPLSFFATGQRIPEDLEVAGQERLLDLILAGQGGRVRTAA